MKSNAHELKLPDYNVAPGQMPLTMEPPFVMPGVTMRVFPVKANMFRLAAFCDRYLNIVPKDVGVFRPASPMVIFSMINYGRMGSALSNVGWVSQNELVFSVFLEWYKEDPRTKRLVFHDWATVTPFLYVDSQTSLATGREVYGWPKVLAQLEAEISPWTSSPRRHRRLMRLSTMVFKDAFAGQEQVLAPLVEIDQLPPPTLTQLPPEWDNPLNPFYSFPLAARGMARMTRDMMEMALRPPLQGYGPPIDPFNVVEMLRRAMGYANPLAPNVNNNTINLKQFRDACHPDEFAYQALTRSLMQTKRFNHIGLLGDTSLMRGDPSCGYRIRVHRYENQPIVDSLGLEVEEQREEGGIPVDVLKPLMPLWVDQDIINGGGETMAWRTQWIPWVRPGDEPDCCRNEELPADQRVYNTARGGALQEISGPFHLPNTTVRVLPLMADRDRLDDFCQTYLDDPLKIARLISGELTPNDYELAIESLGSYVYLVMENYEEQSSETTNIGRFTDRECSFVFPVKLYNAKRLAEGAEDAWGRVEEALKKKSKGLNKETLKILRKAWAGGKLTPEESLSLGKDGRLEAARLRKKAPEDLRQVRADALFTLGLVAPFRYAASNLAAISDREINGWTTVQADILSPEGAWLAESGPARDLRGLAEVRTDVLPAINVGQKLERRTVLEIAKGPTPVPRQAWHDQWRLVASKWAPRLKDDFDRKMRVSGQLEDGETAASERKERKRSFTMMKAMALHLLIQREPFNTFSLKQFRDLGEPSKACYQALVHSQWRIENVHTLEEIEEPIHVGIHRFPSQDIVRSLGLAVKYEDLSGSEPVAWIEPVRPFWAKIDVRTERPEEALYRVSKESWLVAPHLDPRWYFGPRQRVKPEHSAPGAPLAEGLVKDIEEQEFDLWQRINKPHDDKAAEISSASFVVNLMMLTLEHLDDPSISDESREEIKREIREELMKAMLNLEIEQEGFHFDDFWIKLKEGKLWIDGQLRAKRQYLAEAARYWQTDPPRLDIQRAAEAVEEIDEVQAVIESVLSREWLNWGSPRRPRWAQALERIQGRRELGRVVAGDDDETYALKAQKTVERINDSLLELLRAQKPDFYLRADSLGPAAEQYMRQWGLELDRDRDEQYWYIPGRVNRFREGEQRRPAKHPDLEAELTKRKQKIDKERTEASQLWTEFLEKAREEAREKGAKKAAKKAGARKPKKTVAKKRAASKPKVTAKKRPSKKKTAARGRKKTPARGK